MAKHSRITEWQYDYASAWHKWLADNQIDQSEWDTSSATIDKIVKQSGRTKEEVQSERYQAYYELRNRFAEDMNVVKADKEQVLLIRNNELDSACSVYQRADRILTGLPIVVYLNDEVEGQEQAPAWNDGKNITFNAKAIKTIDEATIESLHGLNYHEIAHLLFTPRVGTALGKWVAERKTVTNEQTYDMPDGTTTTHTWEYKDTPDQKRQQAFNILEDCRAEYYLTLKYPSVRPFLVSLIGQYLMEHPEQMNDNFTLLAGRRYFSLNARRMSGALYEKQYGREQAELVYSITNEYRTLVFPRDYSRAQELIEKFMTILPDGVSSPNGCGHRPVMRNGKPLSEKEQETLLGTDPDNKAGKGDKGEPAESVLGWSNEGDSNTGVINPDTKDFNTDKNKELADTLEQAVQRAKADPALRKKVQDTNKAIVKDGSTKSILGKSARSKDTPTATEITASRLFGQELERIRIDSDPAWNLEKPTGKLNVRRAMNADVNEIGKLFDRWELGNDDYDIEASILIDRSGSMYSEIGSACRSAWVIKRGIERINGKVSVMTFSTISRMLYERDDKALAGEVNIVEANGGTDPYYALVETQRIMSQSTAKTKLVFLLTDGGFDKNNDLVIEQLKNSGVYVSVVFLGSERWIEQLLADEEQRNAYAHGAHDFRAITQPIDLVKVAKDVVRANIKGLGVAK